MDSDIIRLDPATIDSGGQWLFWSGGDTARLKKSVRDQGQLEPVLVQHREGHFRLLAGSRRLAVLTSLGRQVLARQFEDKDTEPGLIYLASNTHRIPTDADLVRCIRYFQHVFPLKTMRETICPLLGLDERGKVWKQLTAWMELPAEWDLPLMQGRIGLDAALLLNRFSVSEQTFLLQLFDDLKWSRGALRQFLLHVWETCRKEGIGVDTLLHGTGVDSILQQDLSPKDTIERVLQAVRRRRFPALTGLEESFDAAVKRLGGAQLWRIEPEQHFETGRVVLTARVGSKGELSDAVRELTDVSGDAAWSELFRLGNETGA